MKVVSVLVFAFLGALVDCQSIVVTPPNNQTVPINTDVNVTYNCVVSDNRLAEWVFNTIQIDVASSLVNTLRQAGVFIESDQNETTMVITRRGRERYPGDIEIGCTALTQNTDELDIEFGPINFVRTFDIPSIPRNFDFNPFPGNASRLVLTWDEPDNILIDGGDPVATTYTVLVSGPTFNFSVNTTERRFEFVDSLTNDCAMHDFSVYASNEAGQGMSTTINATIPISPDVDALNSSLRVSSIDVSTGVAVEVTFDRATTCSQEFAVLYYLVSVVGGAEQSYNVTDSRIMNQPEITLPVPSSGLQQNEVYYVIVSACISVTCRHSNPVRFMTTDVQAASVTFFENNVLLECTFAAQTSAAGCRFLFTISENDTETFDVPVSEQRQCIISGNMQNAYPSIVVVDWESEMNYGTFEIPVVRNPEITGAANFTMATGCVPPAPGNPLSPGAIVGIVIGILVAVFLILMIAIVIAIVCYKQRTKKLPKMKSENDEKVFVDFEKQWLMEDGPPAKKGGSIRKGKVSFKRGRSAVDGNEEASINIKGAGGPPPPHAASPTSPDQPSLTSPPAAFRLHISRDQKRARLHLNRALIRQVLKDKRMTTLERKSGRPRLGKQSMRELLVPLHSEIFVTGEESDDDHPDTRSDDVEGEDQHMIAEL